MNKYVCFPSISLIVGSCGGGKSYLLKYIIESCDSFDVIAVFSSTADFTGDYTYLDKLRAKSYIFNPIVMDDKIKGILRIQRANRQNNRPCRVAIIFDDVMGNLKNNNIFKQLCSTFRHYSISLFLCIQYANLSTSYFRELANYVFIFEQRSLNSIKAINENFFPQYTLKEFKQFISRLAKYEFYFINRIENKIIRMKCPSNLTRQIGEEETKKNNEHDIFKMSF